jgi:hypothetical protein
MRESRYWRAVEIPSNGQNVKQPVLYERTTRMITVVIAFYRIAHTNNERKAQRGWHEEQSRKCKPKESKEREGKAGRNKAGRKRQGEQGMKSKAGRA